MFSLSFVAPAGPYVYVLTKVGTITSNSILLSNYFLILTERRKTAFEAEKRQSKYLMPVLKVLYSKACLQPTVSPLIYFLIGDRVPYQVERMAHVIMYLGACPPSICYHNNIIFQFMPKCKESLKKLKSIQFLQNKTCFLVDLQYLKHLVFLL